MRTSALSRLIEGVMRPTHDKRPSIETFADIDVERMASDMELEAKGRERGERNEPSSDSLMPDDVETKVIERIEAERKRAHATAEDEMRTYAERLASLDFEGRFSSIRQALPACVSAFRAEVVVGLNELHGRRRELREAEREHDAFRRTHGLERAAQVSSGAKQFFKLALLAFLFMVETALNGSFLSKGNDQGILGGVTEAFGFAFLNIGVAVLLARGSAQLAHRSFLRKLGGVASFVIYVVLAILLNLALAHYREVTAAVLEGGGRVVVQRLQTAPFDLPDFKSWIFFAIGVLFSIVAFLDGLSITDVYPGFAGVQKRLTGKRQEYNDEVAHRIDILSEVRDQYRDEMEELNRDLSVRRETHDVVLTNRSRMIQLFDQHQSQLERSANALLSVYREANARTRSSPPPKRFEVLWKLDRAAVFGNASAEWDPSELRKRIMETQDLLTAEVLALHAEFEKALGQYRNLDDLVPDEGYAHVPQPA